MIIFCIIYHILYVKNAVAKLQIQTCYLCARIIYMKIATFFCVCVCDRTKYMPRTSSKPSIRKARMNPIMMPTCSMKMLSSPLGLRAETLQARSSVRHFLQKIE